MNQREVYIKIKEAVDAGGWTSTQVSAATAQQALNALKNYRPGITVEQQAEFIAYYPRIQIQIVDYLVYKENLIMVATLLNKLTPEERRWIKDNVMAWKIDMESILQDIQDGVIK